MEIKKTKKGRKTVEDKKLHVWNYFKTSIINFFGSREILQKEIEAFVENKSGISNK
jgi:hypothetical protein